MDGVVMNSLSGGEALGLLAFLGVAILALREIVEHLNSRGEE